MAIDPSVHKNAAAPQSAASSSISLNEKAAHVGVVSEMEKALVRGVNADTIARIVSAFDQDIALLTTGIVKSPSDRVITTNVFVSLIGATVVQVGVAIIAIVNYLFPKKTASPTIAAASEKK